MLAWVERSWAVLAFAAGHLVVTLLVYGSGVPRPALNGGRDPAPTWGFLPDLVLVGGVLLLGGVGFALAERLRA